jgi:hypothetical protein
MENMIVQLSKFLKNLKEDTIEKEQEASITSLWERHLHGTPIIEPAA